MYTQNILPFTHRSSSRMHTRDFLPYTCTCLHVYTGHPSMYTHAFLPCAASHDAFITHTHKHILHQIAKLLFCVNK